MNQLPVLYSFRRCPYAMRARMAILLSNKSVELREILLKEKPAAMLNASSKGTVPVLVLDDDNVIDESIEVMHWAFTDSNPYLQKNSEEQLTLIKKNDHEFKPYLDRYKYHVGYPEHSQEYYREQAIPFLQQLEDKLQNASNLFDDTISFADLAIFPFIRQFAFVDKNWFDNSQFKELKIWLENWIQNQTFQNCMNKYPLWKESSKPIIFSA